METEIYIYATCKDVMRQRGTLLTQRLTQTRTQTHATDTKTPPNAARKTRTWTPVTDTVQHNATPCRAPYNTQTTQHTQHTHNTQWKTLTLKKNNSKKHSKTNHTRTGKEKGRPWQISSRQHQFDCHHQSRKSADNIHLITIPTRAPPTKHSGFFWNSVLEAMLKLKSDAPVFVPKAAAATAAPAPAAAAAPSAAAPKFEFTSSASLAAV